MADILRQCPEWEWALVLVLESLCYIDGDCRVGRLFMQSEKGLYKPPSNDGKQ